MLNGLSILELGRLRISVGYGRQKKGRPLSPVEVGMLLQRARDTGVSLEDCANAINLDGTSHISRFLRILELPNDLQYLISWGNEKDAIGFSSAFELARLKNTDDQYVVAEAILINNLNSKEVRQITQLRKRSEKSISECIKEILDLRPIIETRYVFIGSLADDKIKANLLKITQAERDSILRSSIANIHLREASGRLGPKFFTLVGGERFNQSMKDIGKENIERMLRIHIREAVDK